MPFEDVYGNGGPLSTVGDLLKWNRKLASGKLHPTVFQSMQKPGTLNDGLNHRLRLRVLSRRFPGARRGQPFRRDGGLSRVAWTHSFETAFSRGDLQRRVGQSD